MTVPEAAKLIYFIPNNIGEQKAYLYGVAEARQEAKEAAAGLVSFAEKHDYADSEDGQEARAAWSVWKDSTNE